jgi:regulator of protease activity HflC (stomatin/prohibitin superfamily)
MFGIRFIKVGPTFFVLQYKHGKIVREGAGLSFFYYAPTSSLVLIPIGSIDVPFIFEEITADFQMVTIQGQLTYRIEDPKKLSQLMNFTLAPNGSAYSTDDPQKLPQRLVNHIRVLTRSTVKSLALRDAMGQSDALVNALDQGLLHADAITSMGVQVMALSILAIRPTPDTSRALEAEAREQILREADEAIYSRRNAAVEQERSIKENELNTEIAIENKKRQIRETQMEAEKSVQQKKHELHLAELASRVLLEQKNQDLVSLTAANAKVQADSKAYAVDTIMKALAPVDPKMLQALTSAGMQPGQLMAMAFRELAENADKIGQLNISPDLLREILGQDKKE